MDESGESRAERLARTSEIYRRMRSDPVSERSAPSLDLDRLPLAPVSARALPPELQTLEDPDAPGTAKEPVSLAPETPAQSGRRNGTRNAGFLRRILTRKLDLREAVLLFVVIVVVIYGYR